MKTYYVPKEGVSDLSFTLRNLLFQNFDLVRNGELLCSYESSKATVDVESDISGYIYFLFKLGDEIKVGDLLYIISDNKSDLSEYIESIQKVKSNSTKRITKKAQILLEENGLNIELFNGEIINEQTVLEYLNIKNQDLAILNFNENDLVIIGAGGHAKQCFEILCQGNKFNMVGFVDDDPKSKLYDLPYYGGITVLKVLKERGLMNVILGIGFNGNLKKRDKMFLDLVNLEFNIPTIIHKDSSVSEYAGISPISVQIMANSTLGPDVVLEDNVIVNSGAIVSHDCKIGQSSHITPGAILGGNVIIGKRCTIGMGSTLYLGIKIGDDNTIRNGEAIYVSKE